MRKPGQVISRLARHAMLVMLFTSSLLLVLWPLTQRMLTFADSTQLFGLSVALLAALILDLAKRIGTDESGESVSVQRLSIGDAIRAVADRSKSVGVLRVLAITTETILPALRDSPIRMKTCKVMVHEFSKPGDSHAQIAKTDSLIKIWSELPQRKVAHEVTVKRVQFMPTFFVVIFDDRALIHSLLLSGNHNHNAVHYLEPMLIENRSLTGQELINTFIKQFDDIYDEEPVYKKSSKRASKATEHVTISAAESICEPYCTCEFDPFDGDTQNDVPGGRTRSR